MTDPIVRTARRTWQRLGVPPTDANEMSRELEADLASARADGRDPDRYVGGDAAGFARAWAASRGLVRAKRRTVTVTAAGLAGLLPGAALAVLAVTLPSSVVFNDMIGNRSFVTTTPGTGGLDAIAYNYAGPAAAMGLAAYLGYAIAAVVSAAGCITAVSAVLRLSADPLRARTVRLLLRLGPLVILAACLAGVTAASLGGFTYGADTVALTAAASAGTAALGIAIVRLASFKDHAAD